MDSPRLSSAPLHIQYSFIEDLSPPAQPHPLPAAPLFIRLQIIFYSNEVPEEDALSHSPTFWPACR